jgi:hypothetical protein
MEILRILNAKCQSAGINYILVGGHAVNAYGVTRQTGDVDIAIRERDEEWWRQTVSSLGYSIRYERKGFMLFSPPQIGVWPIDLLCLNEKTFDGLTTEGRRITLGDVTVLVPSAKHLIAMKLHALRENWADRELKDLEDIRQLVKRQRFVVESEEFAQFCKRFGSEKIYGRIKELCSR